MASSTKTKECFRSFGKLSLQCSRIKASVLLMITYLDMRCKDIICLSANKERTGPNDLQRHIDAKISETYK